MDRDRIFFEFAQRTGLIRCRVTDHPCGTDTTAIGIECPGLGQCTQKAIFIAGWDAAYAVNFPPDIRVEFDWPKKTASMGCACRFKREEDFGICEPIEWCAFHSALREKARALVDALEPQEPLFAAYGMKAIDAYNELHERVSVPAAGNGE